MATYGNKRLVTGARYGLRDWLAQRVTGALMALARQADSVAAAAGLPLAFAL